MVYSDSIRRKAEKKTNSVTRVRALSVDQPYFSPRKVLRSRSLNKSSVQSQQQEELEERITKFFDDFFDKYPLSRQEVKNVRRSKK